MNEWIVAVVLCAICVSLPAQAQRVNDYLENTNELVRQGKFEEALNRHIWFHEHALERDPSLYGVRLSFALASWKELGAVYPKALEEMKEIRDKKTALIENSDGSYALFHDVVALNETLGENEKTVQLFKSIDETQEELARKCWKVAKDVIINGEEYELAQKYVGDILLEYRQVKESYYANLSRYTSEDSEEEIIEFYKDRFVKESLQLIEIAVVIQKAHVAQQIQSDALEIVSDRRLQEALSARESETTN